MPSLMSLGLNFKQYAMVAAGGLGLTGSRAPSGPLHAQIGISDPCNHKCVFCWDHPPDDRANEDTADRFGNSRPGVMPLEQFKSIVDDLYGMGTRKIDITGRGEPLANRFAVDMIRYAKARGMQVWMVTNASRLFEPVAKELVAVRMDRLQVSLNAGTPETYPQIHVTESPESYLQTKKNIRALADCKIAAGSRAPFISLSFVINSKNYFEIERMVEVGHEVGAQELQFSHTVIHRGTADLALDEAQYRELQASLPAAREKAAKFGLKTYLEMFGLTTPPYMASKVVGPPVVPCYVGWYFTNILGNGSVLPCCQCTKPISKVTNERRFSEIWASPEYAEFRAAARALPEQNDRLSSCECDNCQLRPRNLAIHNFLHPLNQYDAGGEVQRFTLKDLLQKMRGKYGVRAS